MLERLQKTRREADLVASATLCDIKRFVSEAIRAVEIAARGCDELWLNPGSESDELVEAALARGLNPVVACSIVDVGANPHAM